MPNLINKSQIKIIEIVFKNPGINLREIIAKTRLSPNYVSDFVNQLVERGIFKEEKLEKKRVYLRRFYFNFNSSLAMNLFSLVKEEQKEEFFNKYKNLKPVFGQFINEIKGIDFLLVYGSYSRLAAEKDSDIDILIVGNIKNKDKIREIFVSLNIDTSIKIETLKDFKRKISDPLHQQILKDHIVIYDSGRFINALKKLNVVNPSE
ncbi:winged helix-turn-helix transcriptional regulator [Candidatus Pacearchaeota archaeon]|nr:winged helix-turn-helix transcriptional regulator [Candidatus Pacearchaeota archaeon]